MGTPIRTILDDLDKSELENQINAKADSGHTHSAYVNQSAFSNVTVGSTTIAADSATDTLTIVAGSNVTLTPDATNDKITIAATDTVYTHPTYTAKSSGLYKVTVDGTGHVSGTTAVAKSDITALGIPAQDTTYSAATTSTAGLMSAADKTKLNGIATGATKITVDSALSSTSTNPVQNKVVNASINNLQTQIDDVVISIPVKGVDYWTEADQESIVQQVIAALGTPVFGTIDENNHITLSGHLVDGAYTLSYEDTDGFTSDVCTINKTHGPSYTNQIPISTDTDGSIYNGKGWIENKRINSSGAVADVGSYGYTGVTGFIPIANGDVLRTGANFVDKSGSSQQGISFYKSDKTFVDRRPYYNSQDSFNYSMIVVNDDHSLTITCNLQELSLSGKDVAFVRFSAAGITDGTIITKNEEIV